MARVTMTQRVARSLTLLWVFVLTSAATLAVGAAVLGSLLSAALRQQAVEDARLALAQYTGGVLGPQLVSEGRLVGAEQARAVVGRELAGRPDILSVKVWRADGLLVWTSLGPERIGRTFPPDETLAKVIETREAVAELETLGGDAGREDAQEADLGVPHVIETYAPIVSGAGEAIGAYEIYADASTLERSIAGRKRVIWIVTALVFGTLWAFVVLLARSASTTLRRQTSALRERSFALGESYRRLEESSLEAIESLNATVEAKDPYTAGHALRVQRTALALGLELGLSARELEALRYGALFHDLGKIAVPDVLLTKPERLRPDEYELVKRHAVEGARILAKFERLRDSVAIVRHHHERHDGAGYPQGLGGDEIPLVVAIAALAEAWDGMTIERPYRRALSVEEALVEVEACRGGQFAPVVVDAFARALEKRPADLGVREGLAVPAR